LRGHGGSLGRMADAQSLFEEAGRTRPVFRDPDPETVAVRQARALALYEQAAELGHIEAMRVVAEWFGGIGDEQRQFDWCVRLAKLGEPRSMQRVLGHLPDEFGRQLREAADAGEAWAQDVVGYLYAMALPPPASTGLPAVENWKDEAARWQTLAANQGWAPAQLALARSLSTKDPRAGLALAQKGLAAIEKYPGISLRGAFRDLVVLLGLTKAPMSEQLRAHERAAELDDGEAMTWLGDRYRLGEGVARDPVKARAWYERATKGKGDRQGDAWRELGKMFEAGEGGPPDEEKARQCYENAADLSYDAFARRKLATKYGQTKWASGKSGAKSAKKKANASRASSKKASSAKRKGKVTAGRKVKT